MLLLKPSSIVSIFYLNIWILCIQGNRAFPDFLFHGQRNSSLMKQTLQVESKNKVPEYEIVQLRILSKRSADDQNVIRVHLSAFGKDIDLRLQRDDDFNDRSKDVKFFEARFTDTVQLTEVICEDDDPGTPYIDLDQMAAVAIRHGPNGELQMDGVIGDDLLIKPAPTDINFLADYFVYDLDFSDENGDNLNSSENDASNFFGYSSSATTKSSAHIVYRSAMKSNTTFKVVLDDALNDIDSHDNERQHKRPLHVWPEVLLLVDYDTYAMHVSHGFNDKQIRRYYISFLNGVDLRFKVLSDPKVSLVLTHILIFKSRNATPFLKKNPSPNRNILEGYNALEDLSRYLYSIKTRKQQDIHLDFDVAMLLTKLDICTDEIFDCHQSTVGLAYFKGACQIKSEEDSWMGVAIVEDRGGFDGILTAVHEIGHLLGAIHDGEIHFSSGVQYTSICSDGYIMSRMMLMSSRIFQWSECSIKQLKYFLSSKNASCLFNQPSYHNELEGSDLPGVMLSLDEQCKRILGTRANAWDSRVCVSLFCHKPADLAVQVMLPPAAEGSPCGKDLHCRHGECVSKYLTYSQAWNMVPILEKWDFIDYPRASTTTKPPFIEEACTEDKAEFFCDSYFWVIGSKEACKNSRILEECCYSHKLFCKFGPYK